MRDRNPEAKPRFSKAAVAAGKVMQPHELLVSPPCQVCDSTRNVIAYPDDRSKTLCPDCCATFNHGDGETGHVWEYCQWERDRVCKHCSTCRRDTDYEEHDFL